MNSLQQAFEDFRVEAFRFERLPSYNMEKERPIIAEYLRGALLPAQDGEIWKNQFDRWHGLLRKWTSENKRIIRVRMITTDVSSYVNWELEWAYPRNIAAGESVSVISEEKCNRFFEAIPGDFWLFDKSHALNMKYSDDGSFRDAVEGGQPLEYYQTVRDKLLQNSEKLDAYFSRQRRSRQF